MQLYYLITFSIPAERVVFDLTLSPSAMGTKYNKIAARSVL